jgi:hypothetical protein
MGTLMPAPSVSVPQITFSSPACASCSTSTRDASEQARVVQADAVPEPLADVGAMRGC